MSNDGKISLNARSAKTVTPLPAAEIIQAAVRTALAEDIGVGDATSALLPEQERGEAILISREAAVLCGQAWFDHCFQEQDRAVQIHWHARDGDNIDKETVLCRLQGRSRALLSAERTALNFLQTLSGTATTVARYVAATAGHALRILDTRKTLPGLRLAQKYAVRCGGGHNHRMGLHDAILIKENHILSTGALPTLVQKALQSGLPVTVEVENLNGLRAALQAGAKHILLDNFALETLRKAVHINAGRATLEASGNIQAADLPTLAACGVDCVSIGALTKNLQATDFSLRFTV